MTDTSWTEFIPSIASAVAAVAAAYAALRSLQVSRESRVIAEQQALATHHGRAAEVLSESVEKVLKALEPLVDVAHEINSRWTRDIEEYDRRRMGGEDPRPLRHVLYDIGEMLYEHSSHGGKDVEGVMHSLFCIVRDAPPVEGDGEWGKLRSKADNTYTGFVSVFGKPKYNMPITSANAFRWSYFQLSRRVEDTDWLKVWDEAWAMSGVIFRYEQAYEEAKSVIGEAQKNLIREKKRIAHSAIPLERDPDLAEKYNEALSVIGVLEERCPLDMLELYKDEKFSGFSLPLVIFLVAVSFMIMDITNKLHRIYET